MKGFEREDLGTARTADAPGLFQHACATCAGRIGADGHVVVAARSEQALVAHAGGLVVPARQLHRLARVGVEVLTEQRLEAAAHDVERRSTVDLVPLAIPGRLLRAAVRGDQTTDLDLSDAVGRHRGQMLLDDDAGLRELACVDRGEGAVGLVGRVREILAASTDARAALDPDGTLGKQRVRRSSRIVAGERRETAQHRILHLPGEGVRPTPRGRRVRAHERMRDHLRGDEGDGTTPPYNWSGATMPSWSASERDQRILGDEVQRVRIPAGSVERATECPTEQRGEALRERLPRGHVVTLLRSSGAVLADGDQRAAPPEPVRLPPRRAAVPRSRAAAPRRHGRRSVGSGIDGRPQVG